jgi:Zn-dependent M28 family amino/carboxypeptidase
MRRFATLLSLAFLLSGAESPKPDFAKEGVRWWSHIEVLASDGLEGRNTGSEGHRRAAQFLAGEFERAGLKPAGVNGYIQPVAFNVAQIAEDQSSLAIVNQGKVTTLRLGPDATLTVRPGLAESVDTEAVFCGYGLSIPENQFDDFAGLDLKGKIVVYLAGGPSAIPGNLRSHYSFRSERWKAVAKTGAIGLVAIQNPKSMDIPWARSTLARLNPTMTLAGDAFNDIRGQQFGANLNPANAGMIFAASGHTLPELLALADQGKPLPRFPLNIRFRATEHMKISKVESQNVIGMLPGSDPTLKDQYVVFGAHLDHLGVGAPINGDSIYNGAMDDGSGIASLIEIATIAKEERLHPKRSVLFVAVTGEEKGLLGSEYFTANPTVPLTNIVADINMDMYLPLYPLKFLQVMGLEESTLGADIRAVSEKAGVTVQPDPQPERNLFIRSDQYNFIRHGVPALAFKFGYLPGSPEEKLAKDWLRDRYHAPSDDLNQPVDKEAAARYNRLMLALGLRVADAAGRPHWNADSFFRRFAAKDGGAQ